MMPADSLHAAVHFILLLDVSSLWLPPCHHIFLPDANPEPWTPHTAPRSVHPSNVQASSRECARPADFVGLVGELAAYITAPPGRRRRERKRQTKAEGKTKESGTCSLSKSVCTWGECGTEWHCRRVAGSARLAQIQVCPRAFHDHLRCNVGCGFRWSQP